MDPQRFRETYQRLELLDERLTYKVRSRGARSRIAPGVEQIDERLRDLAELTLELKDIVRELMLSIAGKPQGDGGASGG